ncbi:hypothetical protein [Flavobacterium sp. N2469]|uniref:hypothetical protein n=1 Tax=Flavobacterium sp. N2469 TaxID=2986832 RepID=UPI0022228212|nr:hypothetical protein [Flavobacterium sp. N2469]
MKKSLKTIIVSLFIGALFFLGYQITSKINHKKEILQNIKTIPNFSYQTINGETLQMKILKRILQQFLSISILNVTTVMQKHK